MRYIISSDRNQTVTSPDIEEAVKGAVASKFRTSGQTCVCANRILVEDQVFDEFSRKYADAVNNLVVGDGTRSDTDIGPLINQAAVEKVVRHVDDAVSRGAEVLTGGKRHELGGTYFEPTVLSNVGADMLITREETFGPVAPLMRFSGEEQAVAIANDSNYGLAAYVFTKDFGRVWRVAEALEVGSVGVNTGGMSTETAPAGGGKESGIGREGAKYGIEDYLEVKYLCLAGIGL